MPRSSPLNLVFLACVLALAGCSSSGERVNQSGRELVVATPKRDFSALMSSSVLTLLDPSEQYRIGAGDVLMIKVLDLHEVDKLSELELQVRRDGQVRMPLIGMVEAVGKTVAELQEVIAERLGERYLQDPQVVVAIDTYNSRRIAILGAVKEPGVKELKRNQATVAEALALGGGLSEKAGMQAVLLRQLPGKKTEQIEIELEALLRGDLRQNFTLKPGDALNVLPVERFFVAGFVEKPGEFELRRRTTIIGAIAVAGGIQIPAASPTLAQIRRRSPTGEEILVDVDLVAIVDGEAEDVEIRAGDILEVLQSDARWLAVGIYDFFRGLVSIGVNAASF